MSEQRVLCVPRRCVENQQSFTPWGSADWLFRTAETGMRWLPRREAEASTEFIQPIPCALVVSEQEKYYVFRHIREVRADLKARFSLIVGGHIDWEADTPEFSQLVRSTLTREISEELDINEETSITPIGLVVDHTSLESSRHVGIVHEVIVSGSVEPSAKGEFSISAKYSGLLYSAFALRRLRRFDPWSARFDPWSAIILRDYVAQQPRLF